jgi:hypothetical protein
MYLGDDDYLDKNYLLKVVQFLKTHHNPTAVIPSFINIDVDGKIIKPLNGRDLNIKSKILKKILTL